MPGKMSLLLGWVREGLSIRLQLRVDADVCCSHARGKWVFGPLEVKAVLLREDAECATMPVRTRHHAGQASPSGWQCREGQEEE